MRSVLCCVYLEEPGDHVAQEESLGVVVCSDISCLGDLFAWTDRKLGRDRFATPNQGMPLAGYGLCVPGMMCHVQARHWASCVYGVALLCIAAFIAISN